MLEQEMIKDIRAGRNKQHYSKWATTGSEDVRLELVRAGYELDTLINDDSQWVRLAVMRERPEYVRKRLTHRGDINIICAAIYGTPHVDTDILEGLIDLCRNSLDNQSRLEELEFKLMVEQCTLTLLKKTLSRKELYEMADPLWAYGLSLEKLVTVLSTLKAGDDIDSALDFMDKVHKNKDW